MSYKSAEELKFWVDIAITQICTGSVSLIASTAIVTFIALGGLTSPYRRIIFCLSLSDIFQSFGMVAGLFLSRSDVPQAIWGIGNKHSCQFVGLSFLTGGTAVPMYTFLLGIYYVYKLKGKMTDAQFAHRVEKKIHIIIIVTNLVLHSTALAMDTINPTPHGTLCLTAAWPTGCRQEPELYGECDPAIERASSLFSLVSLFLLPTLCLFGTIACLAMIFWNVVVTERIFGPAPSAQGRESQENEQLATEGDEGTNHQARGLRRSSTGTNSNNASIRKDLRAASERYKKELVIQACLYTGVFMLSFMPLLVANVILVTGSQVSEFHTRLTAITFPLGGFFNILVYSRLNVTSFHKKHPECSRIQAFWLVLKAGGEMPDDRDWNEGMAWKVFRRSERVPTNGEESEADIGDQNHNSGDPESLESSLDEDESSLFPITHADIGKQQTVSDLKIMIRSRPYVSESIPDSDIGMREGSSRISSNNLDGFSNIQRFESSGFASKNASTGIASDGLNGFGVNSQSLASCTSNIGMKESLAGIGSTNNLSGFSDIRSTTTSKNYEDVGTNCTPLMANTSTEIQKNNPEDLSVRDSVVSITGMSQSFDENHPAHRPDEEWDYARGADESPAVRLSDETLQNIAVNQNLESSEILLSHREFSSNLSSLSNQQDHAQEKKDDIWADTFERVRRWTPSE